jgi:hypothetical protein
MNLNAALAPLFYVCGKRFLFQSCSIGNPQYAPEVWHQTPGTNYIWREMGSPLSVGLYKSEMGEKLKGIFFDVLGIAVRNFSAWILPLCNLLDY